MKADTDATLHKLWWAGNGGHSLSKINGLQASPSARRTEWMESPPTLRITARVGPQPHPASFPLIYICPELKLCVCPSANTPSAQLSVQLLTALKNCVALSLAILRKP